MTIREFMEECENWQYSDEAFQVYKEAAEISVLDAWIESKEYQLWNNEGSFMEAEEAEKVDDAKKKSEEKKDSFFKKAWDRIVRMFRTFVRAAKKIIHKITSAFGKKNIMIKDFEKSLDDSSSHISNAVKKAVSSLVSAYKSLGMDDKTACSVSSRGARKVAAIIAKKLSFEGDNKNLERIACMQIAMFATRMDKSESLDIIIPALFVNNLFNGFKTRFNAARSNDFDNYLKTKNKVITIDLLDVNKKLDEVTKMLEHRPNYQDTENAKKTEANIRKAIAYDLNILSVTSSKIVPAIFKLASIED